MNAFPWTPGELVAVPVSESCWALHGPAGVVGYFTSTHGHAAALVHAAADYARCREVADRDAADEAGITAMLRESHAAPPPRAAESWDVDPVPVDHDEGYDLRPDLEPGDHPSAELSAEDRDYLAYVSGNPIWGYGRAEGGAA